MCVGINVYWPSRNAAFADRVAMSRVRHTFNGPHRCQISDGLRSALNIIVILIFYTYHESLIFTATISPIGQHDTPYVELLSKVNGQPVRPPEESLPWAQWSFKISVSGSPSTADDAGQSRLLVRK